MVIPCPLERFLQGYNSCPFLDCIWRQFVINLRVFAFLDTFSVHRFSHTCVVILVDRAEVALAATDWRLGLELSAWSVPTPPVASYSSGSVSSDDDELEADEG